jgi:hypothetical protein
MLILSFPELDRHQIFIYFKKIVAAQLKLNTTTGIRDRPTIKEAAILIASIVNNPYKTPSMIPFMAGTPCFRDKTSMDRQPYIR